MVLMRVRVDLNPASDIQDDVPLEVLLSCLCGVFTMRSGNEITI